MIAFLPDGRMIKTPIDSDGEVNVHGSQDVGRSQIDGGSFSEERDLKNLTRVDWAMPQKPGSVSTRITFISLSASECCTFPSPGISYAFVQGKESACIVTCDLDKDQDRKKTFHDLQGHIIGLGGRLWGCRRLLTNEPVESCAAVSAVIGSDKERGSTSGPGHKAISSEYEQAAIGILRKNLEEGCTDTFSGTIQAALSALQCLYLKKLEPNEIEVFAIEVGESGSMRLLKRLLERGEIAHHLTFISRETSDCTTSEIRALRRCE